MSTPPPSDRTSRDPPPTPEHVRLLAEGRLKAKAKLQERERLNRLQQSTAPVPNPNNKRPLSLIPAQSTSPTNPNSRSVPSSHRTTTTGASSSLQNAVASGSGSNHFKRDDPSVPLRNMIGNYVEYDLATLKNSKGGFLLDSEEDPRVLKEKKLMEENKLKRLENMRKQGLLFEPGMGMDKDSNPKCAHCGSIDLDQQLRIIFGECVCMKCKSERPDEYSLLTKTECREDYLLTEPELKDEELLPHLLRPNPHRPTYSNMMLFLRKQVEAFAFSPAKWGSPQALDDEFSRREAEKRDKKSKKFENKLKELRKKTKTNVWHLRQDAEHRHVFAANAEEGGRGEQEQRCQECGFVVEVEVF